MTTKSDFKTLVRLRMQKTGETYTTARRQLRGQRRQPPCLFEAVSEDNLELALIAMALEGRPPGELHRVWSALARLIGRARAAVDEPTVSSLFSFVLDTEGLTVPPDYDDPRCVQIDRVLARKQGTPAALAGVLVLLARRLDIALYPVAFPGHFLVCDDLGTLFDPASGRAVSRPALNAMLMETHPELVASAFDRSGARGLVTRLLENRLEAFTRRGDGGGALLVSDQLATLSDAPDARLRRGVLLWSLGAPHAGREEVMAALGSMGVGS